MDDEMTVEPPIVISCVNVDLAPPALACTETSGRTVERHRSVTLGGEVVAARYRRLTEAQKHLLDAAGFTEDVSAEGEVMAPGTVDEREPVDAAEVPGLDRVLELVPAAWHPESVTGFLHTPQPDIVINGAPATPLEWLKHSDGDITPVLELIEIAEWTGR